MVTVARRINLGDQIYEEVLKRIVSGIYPENERLPTEAELCREFEVSRPVVREALGRLRIDGLVESRQGAGSFVRQRPNAAVLTFAPVGSIADIQRCFEFRIGLEGEAACLAAERRTEAELAAIAAALASLDEVIGGGRLGVDEDYHFHLAVARATLNPFYVSMIASIHTQISFGMNLARNLSLRKPFDRLRLVQSEHTAIYEAIREQAPEAARNAMRRHLDNARKRVFEGQDGAVA